MLLTVLNPWLSNKSIILKFVGPDHDVSHQSLALSGCLLTIILLMRALDPLGYEKETLAHFQTLKVSIVSNIYSHWLKKGDLLTECFILALRMWIPCALLITATCAASLWLKTPSWKWSMLKCVSSALLTRLVQNYYKKSYLYIQKSTCYTENF